MTFCRICEAFCGLVATVQDGRVTKLEPDKENPHSQGHVCVKGVAFHNTTHDPDRVLTPLKRTGRPGEFEPVSWDEALDDIAARLKTIVDRDGPDAVAFYIGNPSSFATDAVIGHALFMRAIGSDKGYSPGSQDSNARSVANFALFGDAGLNGFPDLPNCEFLLVFGANPLVSNGSILWSPRIRHDLDHIAQHGRVVVIDPRRTETARRYEHVPIQPGGDVWMLIGMIAALEADGLINRAAVAQAASGLDDLLATIRATDLATAATRCGVEAETIRALARDFAQSPRAAAYGRLGVCRSRFATLTNVLVTILNVVTGNFGGRRGGTIFGHRVLAGQDKGRVGGYDETRTRIGNIPSVARFYASAAMPDEILTPGPGQVKALMVTAGNPLHSGPGGGKLQQAIESLDLCVAFDFYRNETAQYAHYILPTPTFLERADFPYVGMHIVMRPFLHFTDPVLPLQGEARHEHAIYAAIIERMGLSWPARGGASEPPGLSRMEALLRKGPIGDTLGENGWSTDRLRDHPHGVMVDLPDPTIGWQERIGHPDGKVALYHPLIARELARLGEEWEAPAPLTLIGRRDIRSINSWMHNVDGLVRSQKPLLIVHPQDAQKHGLTDAAPARLSTRHGAVEVTVSVSEDIVAGTVCYPHGWGHDGGWNRANAAPGTNINALLGLGLDDIEFISGTTLMEGIPVSVAPIEQTALAAE